MQTGTDRILAHTEGAIGWLVFNNPARRNAMSVDMWRAVPDVLDAFVRDESVHVVVLRGTGGKAFISGADISEFGEQRASPEETRIYDAMVARAYQSIARCAKPTVAMIEGFCVGGGVGIAISCDLRFAADDARFAVPAAKLGVGYSYDGIYQLTQLVGPAFAKEIFFTARQFDASEALQMGLVNRVRPVTEIEAFVRDTAAAIGANAPLTIAAVKRCVAEIYADPADRNREACRAAVEACFHSEDYREGRTAFLEKRLPVFRGK